eukprot:RCo035903
MAETISILHFSDVHCLASREAEPVGGAARFASAVASVSSSSGAPPLVLFSGNAFKPSILSIVTCGRHFPPCLNNLGVQAACLGNHDLDYGVANMRKLVELSSFPWLVSNALQKDNGLPLAGAKL